MTGDGWHCDVCGREKVEPSDIFQHAHSHIPPHGWMVVTGRCPAAGIVTPHADICSWECLANLAARGRLA